MTNFLAEELRYLNHAAVALMPLPRVKGRSWLCLAEHDAGAQDHLQWIMAEARFRSRFTKLLNSPSSADVALVKNTSDALSFAALPELA